MSGDRTVNDFHDAAESVEKNGLVLVQADNGRYIPVHAIHQCGEDVIIVPWGQFRGAVERGTAADVRTLRDWFAGQALATLVHPQDGGIPSSSATLAYKIADAMMEERMIVKGR